MTPPGHTPTSAPTPDPRFTSPVVPSAVPSTVDTLDIAKREYERLPEMRSNAERMVRLERIMQLAEATRGKQIDPMLKHWLMSLIEQQKDGSELFLPSSGPGGTGPEVISSAIRRAKESTGASLIEAQRRSGTDITSLFQALGDARKVVDEVKNAGVVTSDLVAAIDEILKKKDSMQKLRLDIDEAMFLTLGAFVEGKTPDELMAIISEHGLHTWVHSVFVSKIEYAAYPPVLDRAFVEEIKKSLENVFLHETSGLQLQVENILKKVAEQKTQNGVERNRIHSELGVERRAFNNKFGGTNAETILNFALTDTTIDLRVLQAELVPLGWDDALDTDGDSDIDGDDRVRFLRDKFFAGAQGDTHVMTDAIKADLLTFIKSKLTANLSGVSLNLLSQRAQHFQILREWSNDTLKGLRDATGNITISAVQSAILTTFGLDPAKIFAAVRVDTTASTTHLNEEQIEALALEIAKAKFETLLSDDEVKTKLQWLASPDVTAANISSLFDFDIDPKVLLTDEDLKDIGITVDSVSNIATIDPEYKPAFASLIRSKQIEKITGKKEANVPLSQFIKDYASEGARLIGSGFDVWSTWILSLPKNVTHTASNDALQKTIDIQDDLEAIEAALLGIGTLEKGTLRNGYLLNNIGRSMKKSTENIEAAHRTLAQSTSLTKPVKNNEIETSVKNAQELAEVGEFIMKELRLRTCFEKIHDPVIRRRAFLIAMYFGIDDAKAYMDNPKSYTLVNGDRIAAILPAEIRFLESGVSSNTHLGPLERYGLTLDPRATIIMRDTLIPGTCDTITLDCPPTGKALALILRDPTPDKSLVNTLIRVYTLNRDEGGLTVEEAHRIVDGIREKLALDDDQLQESENNKTDHRFDPLSTVNSAYEAVKGMINGDTFAERALGWALIGGTAYGIIKAWPKHWKLIMTAPMLLGANIVLKRMTGKSAGDYLNLHYMDPKHRNSPLEQFLRRNRYVEGFEEVESPAGRAAVNVLTDAKNPIPAEELLRWRYKMNKSGATKYEGSAPEALKSKLSPIINEMGTMNTESMSREQLREEALRIAFLAFRAQCVDIDRARGLGGVTSREQEEAGADYIRRMYTSLNPDCETRCPDPPPILGICGIPPCGTYTMREILVLERPSEALMKPLETWTETAFSKAGAVVSYGGEKIRNGYTAFEKHKMQLEQDIPVYIDWAKENIMGSYESFNKWRRLSALKSGQEFIEDASASYEFLKNLTKETGILIKDNGSGAIEFVYDVGSTGVELTKESALSAYRGLKKIDGSGPFLVGLEKFIAGKLDPIPELEFADLTNVAVFKKDIIDLFGRRILAGDTQTFLDNVMGSTLLNIEGEMHLPSRALKMELLKRSLYSYLIATRMQAIDANTIAPNILSTLRADFSTLSIDTSTYKLTGFPSALNEYYNHVFTHYDPKQAGILIGQDPKLGITLDQAAMQEGVLGMGASVLNWFGDSILWDTSGDCLKGSLATYLDPVMKEAKEKLAPDQAELFRSYVETLLMNVIVEMTLSDEDPNVAPLHLTVKRAKEYLTELQIKRGSVPERVIGEDFADIQTALKLYEMPRTPSDAVERMRRDSVKGMYLGAGLGVLAPLPGTPSVAAPTSPVSPSAGPTAAPTAAPATDIVAILGATTIITPDEQTKLLEALPTAGSQEKAIRGKFDALLQGKLKGTPDTTNEGRKELLNALVGASDSYGGFGWAFGTYRGEAEELFLERFTSTANLQFVADEYSIATDIKKRTRLLQVAKRSLGSRLSEIFVTAKVDPPSAEAAARECLQAAQNLDSLAKDRASMLLEYIFCRGDYTSKTFAGYQLFARSIDDSGAQFRFARGLKLSVDTFEDRFNALK